MTIVENRSTGLLVMYIQASVNSVQLDAETIGTQLITPHGTAELGRAGYILSGAVTITNACAAVAKTGLKFTTLRN